MNLRRLSIVLFVFAGMLLVFTLFIQHQKARRQGEQVIPVTQPADKGKSAPAAAPVPTAPADAPAQPAVTTPEAPQAIARSDDSLKLYTEPNAPRFVPIGSLNSRDGYAFQLNLSSRGAGISVLKLAKDFATVTDKRRWQGDPDTYGQALRDEPEKYKGHYVLLQPVGAGQADEHLSMATGMVTIEIEGEDVSIRPVDLAEVHWKQLAGVETGAAASFEIILHCGDSPATAQPLLRIVKTYSLKKEDYSIGVRLRLENLSSKAISVTVDQAGPTGIRREGTRQDLRRAAYAVLQSADQQVQARLKKINETKDIPPGSKSWIGRSDEGNPVLWVGYVNKFFGSMMYLRPAAEGRLEAPAYKARFYVSAAAEDEDSRTYLTGVEIPALALKPAKARQVEFDVYAGPKKRDVFSKEDNQYHKPLYKDLQYIGTIDFGGCFCTFNWLSLAMMGLLDVFSKVALGNYGLAIIILVLLVRLVLHPLTKKSQISMMRMQKLGPQIQKLKEKYADDKNALNKEMMKLYKDQGASPLLGCLPMILQMPIWVALYTGLNAAYELRHASFLPFWITDLAAPDALLTLPWDLPLIGTAFNLLPILLGIAMFFQSKYGPQSAQAGAGSDQAQQTQKMMKYMMPAMMLVIFYKMPSGLNLYIMASTFAGVLDQYFVRKHIREKEASEAARETTIRVPGKVARSSRPKKPKGPFWVKHG